MKFSRVALLMAVMQVSPASAFILPQQRSTAFSRPVTTHLYAVEDLEAKLLGTSTKPESPKANAPAAAPKKVSTPTPPQTDSLSLLKSEMPKYESTTSASLPPPKVEKPQTVPAPKVEKPKPVLAPKVEKPKPVPAPKPAPVVKAVAPSKPVDKPKPKPIPVKKSFVIPPPPKKPSASDFDTVATGVALGGAPLALGALGVLAAARGALAGTAARREKIQEQIAAREAQKKLAASPDIDTEGVITSGIFFGAAGAALALIVLNPFGIGESEFNLPSLSLPSISLPSGSSTSPVSETRPPSAADEARAKIRAAQVARLDEKRAANEARMAVASQKTPPRATVAKKVGSKEADSYDALFQKAAASGPQTGGATKKEVKAVKETKAAVSGASLAESDTKEALEQAKSLTKTTTATPPKVEAKAVVAEVTKDADEAIKKAEMEAIAAAKQLKLDQEAATKAAKEAADIEKKMIAEEKRAIVEKEAEAVKVAAEMDVKAKEMAALAQKTAKGDAVVEAVAAEKVAVAAKAKAVAVPVVAADSPSETPSGGRVLPKEEVSAETMAFLKTLKK